MTFSLKVIMVFKAKRRSRQFKPITSDGTHAHTHTHIREPERLDLSSLPSEIKDAKRRSVGSALT